MSAISAPAKVLLAGGYLVLDRAYTALVFGLTARIHVVVHDRTIDITNSALELAEIVVQSPQFRDATWIYGYHQAGDQGGISLTQLQGYDDFSFLFHGLRSLFKSPSPFPIVSAFSRARP